LGKHVSRVMIHTHTHIKLRYRRKKFLTRLERFYQHGTARKKNKTSAKSPTVKNK